MTTERIHPVRAAAGLAFVAIGLAFALEAVGLWTFRWRYLDLGGPALLVVIGLLVLAFSWRRD